MSDRVDLVFGLVGPIGCLIHEACDSLEYTLKSMDYTPVIINLSAEMDSLLKAKGCDFKDEFESTFEEKILKGDLSITGGFPIAWMFGILASCRNLS